jgi:hypothetical protein
MTEASSINAAANTDTRVFGICFSSTYPGLVDVFHGRLKQKGDLLLELTRAHSASHAVIEQNSNRSLKKCLRQFPTPKATGRFSLGIGSARNFPRRDRSKLFST